MLPEALAGRNKAAAALRAAHGRSSAGKKKGRAGNPRGLESSNRSRS
jgi:hypothetical protein